VHPSVQAVAHLVNSLKDSSPSMMEIGSAATERQVRRLADDPATRQPYTRHIRRMSDTPNGKPSMRFAQQRQRAQATGIWDDVGETLNRFFDRPFTGIDVQDCVACRYIWLQVEMDLGSTSDPSALYDAFTHNCIEAQKVPMFMSACSDMYESINDMIRDYGKDYTVNQMCQNSEICR